MRTFPFPIHALFPVLITFITACSSGDTGTKDAQATDADNSATLAAVEMTKRIKVMEDTLFAKDYFDMKGARALLDVYKAFVATYPLDSISPEYLDRSANVYRGLGDPEAALRTYDRIIKDYPGWRKIPDMYYLKAFVIHNDLGQRGEAEKAYKEVISRFPDHHYAQDARAAIENLKYSDEELIRMWEEKNKGQEGSGV